MHRVRLIPAAGARLVPPSGEHINNTTPDSDDAYGVNTREAQQPEEQDRSNETCGHLQTPVNGPPHLPKYYTGWPKKLAHFVLYALTSSNIDPFSKKISLSESEEYL